jgi:hypothetical protein
MKPDDDPAQPSVPEAPFEFGDRTILALRAQPFAPEHEYGTMMLSPANAAVPRETMEMQLPPLSETPPPAAVPESTAPAAELDPIVRLEQKIDTAMRLLQSLQHQLDSIDATLARALNR